MIAFLYGPDDYRRIQKKQWFIAEFRKKHSVLGLGYFDLTVDGASAAFTEFWRSQSIFETAKLAVLENAFEIPAEALAKLIEPLAEEKTTTVLIAEREKPLKALHFLLDKPTLTQQFDNLEGPAWYAFIRAEATRIGFKLADAAVQFLGSVYQGNSWALVTELEKLAGSEAAGRGAVEKDDLDALDLEVAPNYWALMNGMKSPDGRTRLFALEKLLALNDPAPKLFNIIAAQAGEKTPRMAEYDLLIKSGRLDYEEALLDLAIS